MISPSKLVREQIVELRKNSLWNWPHLSNYGKQMHKAADTMEKLLAVYEAVDDYGIARTTGISGTTSAQAYVRLRKAFDAVQPGQSDE